MILFLENMANSVNQVSYIIGKPMSLERCCWKGNTHGLVIYMNMKLVSQETQNSPVFQKLYVY